MDHNFYLTRIFLSLVVIIPATLSVSAQPEKSDGAQEFIQGTEIETVTRNSFLTPGFTQVKESANFGLVFTGPQLDYGMKWHINRGRQLITYECELGLGVVFSNEIPALGFHLKPLDMAYMFKLPISANSFHLGPSATIDYRYNLYPDLQSGFDYWFTNFSVGVSALYDFKYESSSFRLLLNSSLLGFTSRQPGYRNPHFYDLGFAYALEHLHQDLTPGLVGDYFVTRLECWWQPRTDARITFGYVLEYAGYYDAPKITRVSHGIKLVFNKT